ncbi:kinase-like domain-containing protein [Hygrophoropsis aurantiaca]|uniref:Kinase-like domain-containing protein n=1 Tax=Hygrophoropsis aurantiaca TaxID=72124 RepID=A0ACB7ZS95_9AGAM|nr:kinase-like domain-containing protein [Hygrophoropsis aurantiaca]
MRQLHDRCCELVLVFQENCNDASDIERCKKGAKAVTSTLENVKQRMTLWAGMSKVKRFFRQDDMSSDIQICHRDIADCLTNFQIISHLEIHAWLGEYEARYKDDINEIVHDLSDIKNQNALILASQQEDSPKIDSLMAMMQNALHPSPQVHDPSHGLESNLYHVQKTSQSLLPNLNLERGEVRRLGQYAVGGNTVMDIWEGIYLDEEKVAIKILRGVHSDPKSVKRFNREIDIWKRVWEVDHGRHTLPLYGFRQDDGPFLYIVSPWQPNGTAIDYVKKYPYVDHRKLIRGIAEGILVLHSMDPPVVHGDLKGSTVVIDRSGNPLLADFGFSKVIPMMGSMRQIILSQPLQIIEDITGTAITQSTGICNSNRWLAPELSIGDGIMTPAADVYAFAMTVLELLTHEQPWATIKITHVIKQINEKKRPARPEGCFGEAALERGLDDHIWNLIQACWVTERKDRPTIAQAKQALMRTLS